MDTYPCNDEPLDSDNASHLARIGADEAIDSEIARLLGRDFDFLTGSVREIYDDADSDIGSLCAFVVGQCNAFLDDIGDTPGTNRATWALRRFSGYGFIDSGGDGRSADADVERMDARIRARMGSYTDEWHDLVYGTFAEYCYAREACEHVLEHVAACADWLGEEWSEDETCPSDTLVRAVLMLPARDWNISRACDAARTYAELEGRLAIHRDAVLDSLANGRDNDVRAHARDAASVGSRMLRIKRGGCGRE